MHNIRISMLAAFLMGVGTGVAMVIAAKLGNDHHRVR